jgi:hypothetical protein
MSLKPTVMKRILLTLVFVSYLNINAQNPIQEFNFNGTLNNTHNTSSFMGTSNFVNDRMGTPKSAQRLTNKAMEVVLTNLPQENNVRSVSIWVKFNDIASANYIWGYGTAYNAQYFGLLQQGTTSSDSNLSLASWGAANDLIVLTPLTKDSWYNYTVTFDGTVSKMYRNGELLKAIDGIKRYTKGNIFRLGEINTTVGIDADVDDLQVYDVALTEKQVKELYKSSKGLDAVTVVATQAAVGNQSVKKGSTVAEVKTMAKEALSNGLNGSTNGHIEKKIEVFSKGQKVTNNASSIGDLPEGTYLLKITAGSSKTTAAN